MPPIIHISSATTPRKRNRGRSSSVKSTDEQETPVGKAKSRRKSRSSSVQSSGTDVSGFTDLEEEPMEWDAEAVNALEELEVDDEQDVVGDASSNSGNETKVKQKAKLKTQKRRIELPALRSFISSTAFDVYFAHASQTARVSSNVLSSLVPPLDLDEYTKLITTSDAENHLLPSINQLNESHSLYFPQYWLEICESFNLIFYGYGSKRLVLNNFAEQYCAKHGHVVVINGYLESCNLKHIITSIEQIPQLTNLPLVGTGIEAQAKRLYNFFRSPKQPPLYLIIHNIEGPSLRDTKSRAFLSTIALHPRIHLLASVDHIHTPLLWSTKEVAARKHPPTSFGEDIPASRGYAWLFHDLTTFRHYDDELESKNVTSLPTQNISSVAISSGQLLTEPAANHVLASVTEKAKKLFRLLAELQIGNMEQEGGKEPQDVAGLQKYGTQYDLVYHAAMKQFIATHDVTFKSTLAEFVDHNMVLIAGRPEVLWIPAGKQLLTRLLENTAS